ncbi:hypothetical protein AU892_16460 [Salmonella enterica subsp. diarizonae]|nr:hypothetical protein [Salmonella enterica subsp. diarizonae]
MIRKSLRVFWWFDFVDFNNSALSLIGFRGMVFYLSLKFALVLFDSDKDVRSGIALLESVTVGMVIAANIYLFGCIDIPVLSV